MRMWARGVADQRSVNRPRTGRSHRVLHRRVHPDTRTRCAVL